MRGSILFSLAIFLSMQANAKLVVHEWGTFTSLVGSDGKTQNGMFQEDEELPSFVHNFGDQSVSGTSNFVAALTNLTLRLPTLSRDRCPGHPKVPCEYLREQLITQKMETPVVYFYSDVERSVSFDVWFPGGIISQSYPAPQSSLPHATPGVPLKNGFAHYKVDIVKNDSAQPPSVEPSNIYSNARNVASDLIRSNNEIEKFIFYRGLGEFKTLLQTTSHQGQLQLINSGAEVIPKAFLVYTDGQHHGAMLDLGSLVVGESIQVPSQVIKMLRATNQSQNQFLKFAQISLLNALTDAGLYNDEAQAMVDTWKSGYFKTPGLRFLYILANYEVESVLPVRIVPTPDNFTRAFVGRIEILLDTEEEHILNQILTDGRNFDVSTLGRMAYPILLRMQKVAKEKGLLSASLKRSIDELIQQIP